MHVRRRSDSGTLLSVLQVGAWLDGWISPIGAVDDKLHMLYPRMSIINNTPVADGGHIKQHIRYPPL